MQNSFSSCIQSCQLSHIQLAAHACCRVIEGKVPDTNKACDRGVLTEQIVIKAPMEQRSAFPASASAPHLRQRPRVGAVNHIITPEPRASLQHTVHCHGNRVRTLWTQLLPHISAVATPEGRALIFTLLTEELVCEVM